MKHDNRFKKQVFPEAFQGANFFIESAYQPGLARLGFYVGDSETAYASTSQLFGDSIACVESNQRGPTHFGDGHGTMLCTVRLNNRCARERPLELSRG